MIRRKARSHAPLRAGLTRIGLPAAALWLTLGAAPLAIAAEPQHLVSAGERVAQRNCAECHAIGPSGASPFHDSPPFRTLRARISREEMAQIIRERMETLHPRMPKLELDADEVDDFLDYWDALRPEPAAPGACVILAIDGRCGGAHCAASWLRDALQL